MDFVNKRCVACGRVIQPDDMMFRLPIDTPHVADMILINHNARHGIESSSDILPDVISSHDSRVLEVLDNVSGKRVLIMRDGRAVEKMVCPTCHNKIYVCTDDEQTDPIIVYGMPDSGKTSLIIAIAKEVTELGYDIAQDSYICFLNDQCLDIRRYKADLEKLRQGEKPDDIRQPVLIHRSPSVQSGLSEMSDVFYDAARPDMADEFKAAQMLPYAQDARTFVFVIDVSVLFPQDKVDHQKLDFEIRQELYKLYFRAQYSRTMPKLAVVFNKADKADSDVILNTISCEADMMTRFYGIFPMSAEIMSYFKNVTFNAVSCLKPVFSPNSGNSLAGLYRRLIL